ncbi:protein of unknown function [Streptomyces sp. KY75]|nr:protein of unknown function [Streptomyces sp. KY75]CAD5994689.1 protein of unknown function [Streptomyces sp. KY70]
MRCCTAMDPAESDADGSVLLLATPVRSELSGAAARQHVTADRAEDLARYEALLSAVPQVVWRMTADQGETFTLVGRLGETGGGLWNPTGPGFSWMDAVHPKDQEVFAAQWAATARGDALLDAVVRIRQEGESVRYRHMRIVTVPVLRDGAVVEWIGTVADAEDQWKVRTRDRLLERVSAVSSSDNLLGCSPRPRPPSSLTSPTSSRSSSSGTPTKPTPAPVFSTPAAYAPRSPRGWLYWGRSARTLRLVPCPGTRSTAGKPR